MRVESIFRPGSPTCRPGDTLIEAARRMQAERVDALVVGSGTRPIGVISEHDLVRAVAEAADPETTTVGAYATQTVYSADPQEDTFDVMRRMLDLDIRRMPVLSEGRVVGIVAMRDLLALEAWV